MNDTIRELRAAATIRMARDHYAEAVERHRSDSDAQMAAGHVEDAERALRWADALIDWATAELRPW